MNNIECNIRLLQPANTHSSAGAPFIELFGIRWVFHEYDRLSDAPPYTCISYVWKKDRIRNPLEARQLISARTMGVIQATIQNSQSPTNWISIQLNKNPQKNAEEISVASNAALALWIDALCVPTQEPARTSSLLSMGAIYSSAWQVFAVLSEECSAVLRQIRDAGKIDEGALSILENDEWITRCWTYQEIVNSRSLYFIAEGDDEMIVSGADLLNAVLASTDNQRKSHDLDTLTWGVQHPNLYRLECLIADYMISQYSERSAYQVMSAMSFRTAETTEDYFYSMVGAITSSSFNTQEKKKYSASEHFMQACESKGDYSFIYNIAPRSEVFGLRWRPIEGKFPPVYPELVIFGSGQSGSIHPTHIKLDNVYRQTPGAISSEGLRAITSHLATIRKLKSEEVATSLTGDVAKDILILLRERGFSGCGEYLQLENGFFFYQNKVTNFDNIFAAICLDVRWQGGAPGLLLRARQDGINEFCDVGAFFGMTPKFGESINTG